MPTDKGAKTSESRKSSKPIMEKRRRARINESLNNLKTLILETTKKDSSRNSKLEKADILEMTVKYLRNLQRQQVSAALSADPGAIPKYRAGFNECFSEVQRYLSSVEGVDTETRTRLLNHLANYSSSLPPSESHPPTQRKVGGLLLPKAPTVVPPPTPSGDSDTAAAGATAMTTTTTTKTAATMIVNYDQFSSKIQPSPRPILPQPSPPCQPIAVLVPQGAISVGQFPSHFIPVYAQNTPAALPSPMTATAATSASNSSVGGSGSQQAMLVVHSPPAGSVAPRAPSRPAGQPKAAAYDNFYYLPAPPAGSEARDMWRPW